MSQENGHNSLPSSHLPRPSLPPLPPSPYSLPSLLFLLSYPSDPLTLPFYPLPPFLPPPSLPTYLPLLPPFLPLLPFYPLPPRSIPPSLPSPSPSSLSALSLPFLPPLPPLLPTYPSSLPLHISSGSEGIFAQGANNKRSRRSSTVHNSVPELEWNYINKQGIYSESVVLNYVTCFHKSLYLSSSHSSSSSPSSSTYTRLRAANLAFSLASSSSGDRVLRSRGSVMIR